ncbi:MAG: hypothetical protein JEY99_07300 [Spirochaetales bacterium]|nr:hypothetical protein [Spirochaetales bacterium]
MNNSRRISKLISLIVFFTCFLQNTFSDEIILKEFGEMYSGNKESITTMYPGSDYIEYSSSEPAANENYLTWIFFDQGPNSQNIDDINSLFLSDLASWLFIPALILTSGLFALFGSIYVMED